MSIVCMRCRCRKRQRPDKLGQGERGRRVIWDDVHPLSRKILFLISLSKQPKSNKYTYIYIYIIINEVKVECRRTRYTNFLPGTPIFLYVGRELHILQKARSDRMRYSRGGLRRFAAALPPIIIKISLNRGDVIRSTHLYLIAHTSINTRRTYVCAFGNSLHLKTRRGLRLYNYLNEP